jgi:hypothetical protein
MHILRGSGGFCGHRPGAGALVSIGWAIGKEGAKRLLPRRKLMSKLSKAALILGLAGGLAGLPSLTAQQTEGRDEGGVAGAIRYEKAKQAAADRQARIEEGREHAANSADRMAPEGKSKTKAPRTAAAGRKTPPAEPQK